MEPKPSIASIPQTTQLTQGDTQVKAKTVPTPVFLWSRSILWAIVSGMILSLIMALIIAVAPYNRVVIFPQVRSSIIQLASVRLKDPGFVMVYLETDVGLLLVGASGYLVEGYYPRMVIPISLDEVENNVGRIITVRLLKNTGSVELDEPKEIPIRTLFGRIYQKKVTFLYPNRKLQQWLLYFFDDPLGVIGNYLIP